MYEEITWKKVEDNNYNIIAKILITLRKKFVINYYFLEEIGVFHISYLQLTKPNAWCPEK